VPSSKFTNFPESLHPFSTNRRTPNAGNFAGTKISPIVRPPRITMPEKSGIVASVGASQTYSSRHGNFAGTHTITLETTAMIEQDKYTDETIHVANWLLLSGNVDIEKLIALTHRETAMGRKSPDEENDSDYEDDFKDELAYFIRGTIDNAISEAMPDQCGTLDDGRGFGATPEFYKSASPTDLLIPFVSFAFDKVDFGDVGELLLSHSPALVAA
jgi:hypothetical protein